MDSGCLRHVVVVQDPLLGCRPLTYTSCLLVLELPTIESTIATSCTKYACLFQPAVVMIFLTASDVDAVGFAGRLLAFVREMILQTHNP